MSRSCNRVSSSAPALLVAVLGFTLPSPALSQTGDPSPKEVATHVASAHDLPGRRAALQRRLETKQAYVQKLLNRVERARRAEKSRASARRLSQFTYQAFFVWSRTVVLSAKLRDIDARISLKSRLGRDDERTAVDEYLSALRTDRRRTIEAVLREAGRYSDGITEAPHRAGFEQHLEFLRAELRGD